MSKKIMIECWSNKDPFLEENGQLFFFFFFFFLVV